MKEINENAWLIVFVLFAILGCLFSGCYMAPNDSQTLVINRIEKRNTYCEYKTEQGWWFTTDCGNFNIGDKVRVNYLKQVNQDTLQ